MALKPKKYFFGKLWQLIKEAGIEFFSGNDLKYSASLSYYTVFSLPPLLIIIISCCGFFFGPQAARGEIYEQIAKLVGQSTALQIQEMIKNVALSKNNTLATTIGIVTLIFGASGVFSEIQDSINQIWGIKAKPDRGLVKIIRNRIISFSMIAAMGFLMLVSLLVNALMDALNNDLKRFFPAESVVLFYILNVALIFILTTILFAVVFKTLPDGKVAWKDALIGSTFTALFFMLGKAGIGFYLGNSSIATTYGAAGSLIVILLWVYYSAFILYFGAEFTKAYAFTYGSKIIPNSYAVFVETKLTEKEPPPKTIEEPKKLEHIEA